MNDVQYIIVTKWKDHWDNFWSPIANAQSTLFTHSVITDASFISFAMLLAAMKICRLSDCDATKMPARTESRANKK